MGAEAQTNRNRGIVIHAGGSTYFANAWVASCMLRHVGCRLPIQWWYKDSSEYLPYMPYCAEKVVATLQDASKIRRKYGHPPLAGWPRKPYSIIHCPFDEVLLLDADNMTVRDPSYLFDHELYQRHRCLFWPDFRIVPPDAEIWKLCGIEPVNELHFQGGQQIIDKVYHREVMDLTMTMNFDADFWYKHTHGEQDLYRMAWLMTGTPYSMVSRPPSTLKHSIVEYCPEGLRMFQHRCADKWKLDGSHDHIPDFWFEDLCNHFLGELKHIIATRTRTVTPFQLNTNCNVATTP